MDNNFRYDEITKTLYVNPLFNEDLTGVPVDTQKIKFVTGWKFYSYVENKSKFNKPIGCVECINKFCPRNLPLGLKKINFKNGCFSQCVDCLPESLISLKFGQDFNQPVKMLPSSLLILKFGYSFNQCVDYLPSNLTHLTFEYNFNQPIKFLPKNLKYLVLGRKFNFPLDNLPETLTYLETNTPFVIELNTIPKSLKELYLGTSENFKKYPENLSNTITHLSLYCYKKNNDFNKLPNSITHLTLVRLEQQFSGLPSQLSYLEIDGYFNNPIGCVGCDNLLCAKNLPNTIRNLIISESFDQCVDYLPSGLISLSLSTNFNKPVDKLPKSLKKLDLYVLFNQLVDKLPSSLTHLTVGCEFDNSMDKLPESLISLSLHDNNTDFSAIKSLSRLQEICIYENVESLNYLPSFVKKISIKSENVDKLSHIPENIEILELYFSYSSVVEVTNIPSHIKKIVINEYDGYYIKKIKKIPFGCVIVNEKDKQYEFL